MISVWLLFQALWQWVGEYYFAAISCHSVCMSVAYFCSEVEINNRQTCYFSPNRTGWALLYFCCAAWL